MMFMADELNKYRRAVEDGINETKALVEQKKAIEAQIRKVQQLTQANINMLPDEREREKLAAALEDVQGPIGLRQAILKILVTGTYMPVPEIRMRLIKGEYDLSGHINPLASIHTTLKRLGIDGEVESTRLSNGRIGYRRKIKHVTVKERS